MTPRGDATDISRRGFLRATAAGTTAAAATGTASAAEQGGGTKTVEVGPNGDTVFTPGTEEPLYVKPGTTVKFVWKSDTHNIVVESQPEGAGWEGHETIENTGFEYEHTFDTKGTYDYFCQPHKSLGMTGTIEVTDSPPTPEPSHSGPQIPAPARTMGLVATGTMISTLGVAYFFLKYGDD